MVVFGGAVWGLGSGVAQLARIGDRRVVVIRVLWR